MIPATGDVSEMGQLVQVPGGDKRRTGPLALQAACLLLDLGLVSASLRKLSIKTTKPSLLVCCPSPVPIHLSFIRLLFSSFDIQPGS